MTAHKYYKRGLVTAEQFDGSEEMAEKYQLFNVYKNDDGVWWQIKTLEGWLDIKPSDWIATGVNGEHWPIADEIFRKTYQALPVIPKAVGEVIRREKMHQHENGGHTLENVFAIVDEWTCALGLSREDTEWINQNPDAFALAWLLGEWEVEQ